MVNPCLNLSAINLAHNQILHSRTKKMELDVFFVKERVFDKQLAVQQVPSQDQWADLLAKSLSSARFSLLWAKCSLQFPNLLKFAGVSVILTLSSIS